MKKTESYCKATKPKVSIVVPIYNVERYLRECVDSIINQTLKDIEIILVDDGSPDKCGEIIDEYSSRDRRVVAVHQKNGGYSKAVNKGIDIARGEYIGIIESDDWIEPDMYEKLYNNAKSNGADITKGGFYFYNSTLLDDAERNIVFKNGSGVDLRKAPNGVFEITEWPKLLAFHASIWSSIYRADFVKKIKIPETAGASYQDFPFMVQTMCSAKKITVVKKPFVHWRNDPKQGNSTSANGKKLLLMAENTRRSLEILKSSGKYEALKEAFYIHAVWANLSFFHRINFKYKRDYYEKLRNIFLPLKSDDTFRYLLFGPIEKQFVDDLLADGGWPIFMIRHYSSGAIRKAGRGLLKILPTQRAIRYTRNEVIELSKQNDEIVQELEEIKSLLKKQ